MGFTMRTALTASTLLLAAGSAAMEYVACYDTKDGLTNQTSYTYQSTGWCQDYCEKTDAAVFALTAGADCLCGDELPPSSGKVPDSKCNTNCQGWPSVKCGGSGVYSVYLTGLQSHVSEEGASSTNSGHPSQETDESAAASTQPERVTITSSVKPTPSSSSDSGSSHNTAAIAAGVVVGVVGFAALLAAAFFFYRHKKRQQNEGFGNGGSDYDSRPPPMSDSRFDGTYMAQRRQSNGSIDENHDFSRRILQVANPDRY